MTFYELLVLVHVVAAIALVGGAILLQVQGTQAQLAGDEAAMLKVIKDSEGLGTKLFMPAGIVVLVFGIWAVIDNPVWEFSDPWVGIGFTGIVLSAIIGGAFFGPEAARIAAAAGDPAKADEAKSRIKRFVLVTRVDLLILLIAVWAMAAKPGA